MARFLFWNMDGRALEHLAATIVVEHSIDVVLVAEPNQSALTLNAINAATGQVFREEPGVRRDRIRIFSRLPVGKIKPLADTYDARAVRLRSSQGDVLIAAVHVGSKLFADENDQLVRCSRLAKWIADVERRARVGSRTVVVGDFNANPFDKGLTGTTGFHAVMSREIARGGGRKVDKTTYPYYYNPMWNLLGDHPTSTPPGTFYYAGKHFSTIWHLLDQVLLRPTLLDRFSPESVTIVHTAGGTSLLDGRGRPARGPSSDHLPIVFELTT